MMLANMQWAISEAHKIQRHIAKASAPEIKLAAVKELARMRDRPQSYAVQTAPYVHPKLHAVASMPAQEAQVEVDPLREHLEEMAKVFGLKSTSGKAA